MEKCPSQFLWAQGDVFKFLFCLSPKNKYYIDKEKQYQFDSLWASLIWIKIASNPDFELVFKKAATDTDTVNS